MKNKSTEEALKSIDEHIAEYNRINDTYCRLMEMTPMERDMLMDDKILSSTISLKIGDGFRKEDHKFLLNLVFNVIGKPDEGFKLIWKGLQHALTFKFDDLIYGEEDPNDLYAIYPRKPLPKRYGYKKK
ncbi:hypothetical protein MD537_09700 [Flavihumibacter sediminis]|nr:hypothetical protein [Flavihumibacter sediminis]